MALSAAAAADPLPAHSPQVCSGYNPGDNEWGFFFRPIHAKRECPAGYALMTANFEYRKEKGQEYSWPEANCCPLPASDILTEEQIWVRNSCPEDSVITGMCTAPGTEQCPGGAVRCTKINRVRYQLAGETRGVLWGFASRSAYPWREVARIKRSDVPVALRFGASRLRKLWMSDYGCIGDPAGSLLTGTNGWRCLNGTFRALEFSGLPGDPPRGARVQMLPECDRLSDLTSEHPECINDLRKHDR